MAKKITAPHSYDPGKGRPKEYLAYLNQREMDYLRSINGNNMERGPRGLPSFPPEDAVGSSSKAGSKGPGGPSGPNSGPSRSTTSGGGGKGPGGPSGPNSSPSRSTGGGGNLGGGGKGPGGPSGPNSAPSGTRGVGGPSSPMGGQGPSFSRDTKVQQDAQTRNAISAVKNSPAFRSDASSGGIRTLSVGPMGTPVNVGPRVPPTQNRASVVGGWGVQAFNSAMPKAPSLASPMTAPTGYRPKDADQIQRSLYGSNKQIYDRVPIGKQFKELGIGYDERIPAAPLGPREYSPYGMDIPTVVGRPNLTPEQQAQAGAELQRREQELRDFLNREADPFPTGNPNMAGNPTVAQSRKENPLVGTGYGTFNIAGVDRIMAAPENLPPEKTPTEARDRSFSNSFASSAAAATPGSVDLRGAGYGTFNVPKSAQIDAEIRGIERDINAPSISEKEKILKIENVPESSGMSFTPGLPKKSKEFGDRLVTINGVTREVSPSQMSKLTPKDQNKIADYLQKVTYTPPKELRSTAGTWTQSYDVPLSEKRITVKPDDQIAGDVYGPKNVDPKVQELMRDVDKMNRRGTRIAKSVPVVGAGFRIADAFRDVFTGKNTAESDADLKRAYMQGSPAQRAALEKKNPNLTKFAQLAGLKPQLPMSNYENWRQRSFGFGGSGIGNSTVSGGSTDMSDIRGGGKNKPIRVASAEEKTPTPKAKSEPKEGGRRPAIYYKWDLGIDVPSPTDSDYTLYTKYLQEKAAAKAGMA